MATSSLDGDNQALRRRLPATRIPLGLRLPDGVLRLAGANDVAKSSTEEIVAAQKPLPRNVVTDFLFGSRSSATSLEIRRLATERQDSELRLHRPQDPSPSAAVLYLHGGGWVGGDAGMSDWWCSEFAARTGMLVGSFSYSLAPLHRFPQPLEDCYRALCWLSENAIQLGVLSGRLIVAGDSAGGNLAAALCLLAHERGGPAIGLQILINPALDLTFASPSVRENANAPLLSEASIKAYAGLYLGEQNPAMPLASPIFVTDAAKLPPALIQVGQYDPLRDDGWRYAARLQHAGVPVRTTEYPGAPHGLINFPGLSPVARQAVADAVARAMSTA